MIQLLASPAIKVPLITYGHFCFRSFCWMLLFRLHFLYVFRERTSVEMLPFPTFSFLSLELSVLEISQSKVRSLRELL
jgi:hypothetical protein